MRRDSYVCEVCGEHVANAYDRYEERGEIRRWDRKKSLWSRVTRKLCLTCAKSIAAERRSSEIEGQGALAL